MGEKKNLWYRNSMFLPSVQEISSFSTFTAKNPLRVLVSACLTGVKCGKVVSQRDFKTLGMITKKLDRTHEVNVAAVDHHETNWYQSYFKNGN